MKLLKTLTFLALMGASTLASAKTIEMNVNGLVCAFCAQGIEKTMKGFSQTTRAHSPPLPSLSPLCRSMSMIWSKYSGALAR